jgi:hypothetical protein
MDKYWPIHGYIRETVVIHQKLVMLTEHAIVLESVEIGGYNGIDGSGHKRRV